MGFTAFQSSAASDESISIIGVDTNRGMPTHEQQVVEFYLNAYTQLEIAEKSEVSAVVFPESAFGEWREEISEIFKDSDVLIFGGARIFRGSDNYVNALVLGNTGEVIYEQESPIPIQPSGRARSVAGGNQANKYPSVIICNEIADVWRSYSVFSSDKKTVIWIANVGWSESRYIADRLVSNAQHWARLFNKDLITAVNRHG